MTFTARIPAAVFMIVLSAAVSAATLSIQMYETGVPENAPKIEATSAWEAGLLDAFFEAGHIVSNAETKRLEKKGLPSTSVGLAEAREGGAEFIIALSLDYGPGPLSNERTRKSPKSIAYRLSDRAGDILFQAEIKEAAPTNSGAEDASIAQSIARALIVQMKKGR